MLIACVQSDVTFARPNDNLTRVLAWMEQAAKQAGATPSDRQCQTETNAPADLVVFPECMLTGYTFDSREEAMEVALVTDDAIFVKLAEAAGEFGQVITVGFLERCDEKLYNAAALVGSEGVLGLYRKVHLPGLGVDRFVDRGDRPYEAISVETPRSGKVNVGLAICYDASFPEPMRALALAGVDVIALGTNWPNEATHTPRIVPPARSMENHLYFVAANRVGTENGFGFCGRSSICGPDGVVLASCDDDRERILFAEVDPTLARNKTIQRTEGTHVIDRFADRCPDFYRALVEPKPDG